MPETRADQEGKGWACLLENGFGTAADRKNQIRFIVWTFVWMVGYTLAAQAIKREWGGLAPGEVRTMVVALLPNVLAIGAIGAYVRFLRRADELTRLVQLQGMAVGFGASVLLLLNWDALQAAGAPALDSGDALMIPMLAWVVGQIVSALRYK